MHFDLKQPCVDCPFRTDIDGYLLPERAEEIADALVNEQASFPCHKTLDQSQADFDEYGNELPYEYAGSEQHCAGAAIWLLHQKSPNQWMRISAGLFGLDLKQFDMTAPVFTTREAFVEHHAD